MYETNIDFEEYAQSFQNLRLVTNVGKLQSFQYRFLHRAIIFNDRAYHWKVAENNKCSFCDQEKETQLHVYCNCPVTENFWVEISDLCNKFFKQKVDISDRSARCLNLLNRDPKNVVNLCVYWPNNTCTVKDVKSKH